MRAEHIREWLLLVTREETPDTSKWKIVVDLVQNVFREGQLPVDCTRQTVVFLPKGNGKFWGIGLVEVIWKTASGIIIQRIGKGFWLHYVLHGF